MSTSQGRTRKGGSSSLTRASGNVHRIGYTRGAGSCSPWLVDTTSVAKPRPVRGFRHLGAMPSDATGYTPRRCSSTLIGEQRRGSPRTSRPPSRRRRPTIQSCAFPDRPERGRAGGRQLGRRFMDAFRQQRPRSRGEWLWLPRVRAEKASSGTHMASASGYTWSTPSLICQQDSCSRSCSKPIS